MIQPDFALLARLDRTIREQRLFHADDTIIVAISGGADSTALLDLLSRLPGHSLHLVAAHLNHCLRGAESDADQEFCKQLAARYAIPYETTSIDIRTLAAENRLNLEDAGRHARIDFLDALREKYGAKTVALAHHADDQAETVLMRLLRGSGMTGLSGMAYRNERGYVRPLLEISRPEIEQYLRRNNLDWREDSSNSDTSYLRNRIRHELLPHLEEYNPAIRSCLANTALILAEDELLLEELTYETFSRLCKIDTAEIVCSTVQFVSLPAALQRRLLRHAFKQLTGNLNGLGQRHIDSIRIMLDSDRPNSRLALPQEVSAVREYGRFVLKQTSGKDAETAFEILITGSGFYPLPSGGSLTVEFSEPANNFVSLSEVAVCLDLDKTPFPWLVRKFQPGDRITPFGMNGRKKVKDVFIDHKIPLSKRQSVPLIFCGDDLIWIAGLTVSELCRTDNRSTATVQVTWQEPPNSTHAQAVRDNSGRLKKTPVSDEGAE